MKRTALFGLAFVSMACGGGSVISSRAQADTSSAEFVFDGTFGYHGEGTIAPGAVGAISYDVAPSQLSARHKLAWPRGRSPRT